MYICMYYVMPCLRHMLQSASEIEKEQEAKLKSKFPGMKSRSGQSAFLQKRMSKEVTPNVNNDSVVSLHVT